MYRYFFVRTDCYTNTWETKEIERFIESKNLFLSNGNGGYKATEFLCDIQLLLVNDWDSWNSNDYDGAQTNYINIVAEDVLSDECELFLKEFSEFLGWNICEEV